DALSSGSQHPRHRRETPHEGPRSRDLRRLPRRDQREARSGDARRRQRLLLAEYPRHRAARRPSSRAAAEGDERDARDASGGAAEARGAEIVDKILPLIASGDAGTRSAVMKILIGMGNPAAVIKRYVYYSKTLAGFVRDRALESMRAFGDALMEPAIELLFDP